MISRVLFSLLLIVSASAFPVFITIILGIIGLVLYKNYYELIPIFFIHDVLYGVPRTRYFGFMFVMTAFAFVLVLLAGLLRKQLFHTGPMKI